MCIAGSASQCSLLLFRLLLLGLLAASPAAARDNFLVLMADDVGVDGVNIYSRDDLYGHLGEGANPGPTPTIDQLALDGVLFRNAWANAQCSPARAATLTGRHGVRTGIGTPGGAFLPLSETTLAELLGATHETSAIGKWHISAGDGDHPIDQGFDYYAGPLSNAGSYFSWTKTTNSESSSEQTQADYATYITTDNVQEARDQIVAAGESAWFVWLAFTAPHAPFHVPPDELTTIAVSGASNNAIKWKAAIEAMDTEIAWLLGQIPQSILDDTTIVFIGDNGSPSSATEAPFLSQHAKGSVYEGGLNVPLIIRSPHIDPADQGSESLAFVNHTDLFATVAEIVGAPSTAVDSLSLLPYLRAPSLASQRRCAFSESFSPNGSGPYNDEQRAARDERYKLIWRDGVYEEFFDLDQDRWEEQNLLPFANLDPTEAAAYLALADSIDHGTCALPVGVPAVPLPAIVLAALLLGSVAIRQLPRHP